MDYFEADHVMKLYGLLPNMTPFIRFPPGLSLSMSGLITPNQLHDKILKDGVESQNDFIFLRNS